MLLIDTHTHLYLEQFDNDRDQVIKSAIDQGIKHMLLPNIDQASFTAMQQLHQKYPENCLPMIGLHPTSVQENYLDELELVAHELEKGGYYGVGEIGIDLYWDKTFRQQQQFVFRKQLKLAKQYKLPVSIHTRDAFDEIYQIVSEEKTADLKGVFHCFTGTKEQADKIIALDFLLGIGGVVTFKNSNLGEVLKDISLQSMVLETDAPFLAPSPYRGKRNESAYTYYIAKKLAEIKNTTIQEVAGITSENAISMFNLE